MEKEEKDYYLEIINYLQDILKNNPEGKHEKIASDSELCSLDPRVLSLKIVKLKRDVKESINLEERRIKFLEREFNLLKLSFSMKNFESQKKAIEEFINKKGLKKLLDSQDLISYYSSASWGFREEFERVFKTAINYLNFNVESMSYELKYVESIIN